MSVAAVERVVAIPADQFVISGISVERIVTDAAVNNIPTVRTVYNVIFGSSHDFIFRRFFISRPRQPFFQQSQFTRRISLCSELKPVDGGFGFRFQILVADG